MRPGDRVYETIDGGGLRATVIAVFAKTRQVLVRLDDWASEPGSRERFRNRGYVVFRAASLTEVG